MLEIITVKLSRFKAVKQQVSLVWRFTFQVTQILLLGLEVESLGKKPELLYHHRH